MNILLLHNAFPGHFPHIARALTARGHQVVFGSLPVKPELVIPGVKRIAFQAARPVNPATHPFLYPFEAAVLQGQAAYRKVAELMQHGFTPDLIYGHSGFGATLYMKDLLPKVPLVSYFEMFYRAEGAQFAFTGPEKLDETERLRIRSGNAAFLQDLFSCDFGITPTKWQANLLPPEYGYKIRVIHDGVDTSTCCPTDDKAAVRATLPVALPEDAELLTYTTRGMEPMRGFPQFMEALALLQKRRPKLHCIVVGRDTIEYDPKRADGKTYKEYCLEQLDLDLSRLHFIDWLPFGDYIKVLQASMAHIYLTKPFVLSWSILEAMACGCAIVGSDTAPVREVMAHEQTGLLADLFSPTAIADSAERLLTDRALRERIGKNARDFVVEQYSLDRLLPEQIGLLEAVAAQLSAKK